jgi:hypothetical protein
MRRILVWLFGVPIALVFLTAWSRPSHRHVDNVKEQLVEQSHRAQ